MCKFEEKLYAVPVAGPAEPPASEHPEVEAGAGRGAGTTPYLPTNI